MRCAPPVLEPGGGGVNVARAITKLGGRALALFPVGGYTGKYLTDLLGKEGVSISSIETKTETRENLIILDKSSNEQYRFGMPAGTLSEYEWKELLQRLDSTEQVQFIVVSGSLPPEMPDTIFAEVARIAKKKNARIIVDTSGEALRQALREGVYLIKPSLTEFRELCGKPELQKSEIPEFAKQLIKEEKCKVIVVSMGNEGALLVTDRIVKKIIPPPVVRKSTVGAGDSMVAGIVLSLSQGNDIETAVDFGVACGTAATMNPGTALCKPADVHSLYEVIVTKRMLNLN